MSARAILALRGTDKDNESFRDYANKADGEGAVITFSFMNAAPEGSSDRKASTFSTYSAQEKATVYAALGYISSIANVTFVESDAANSLLAFGQYDFTGDIVGSGMGIYYNKVLGRFEQGQVWADSHIKYNTKSGQGIHTLLHEIGHALGLQHPFEGPYALRGKELASSAMGYDYTGPDNKMGVYDIMALQEIYGTPQVRLGTNTYKMGNDKYIFDAGGIDTLDASAAKYKVSINLEPGSWSYVNKKAGSVISDGQVVISKATVIENARGSKFNDTITGNSENNTLKGGAGNDKLYGGAGDDKLYGESGNDLLSGGDGMDYLSGGAGNDTIWGGAGADRLYGGSGKDQFKFNSYGDLGDLNSFDRIYDFRADDKINFRSFDANPDVAGRQKMTFLGNSTGDWKLNANKAGQFYYNTATDNLVIDSNGDGVADHYIGVKGVSSMKAAYFML
ncbi:MULTISPECIES: M10 family metallopeptidase C-terminal domain-containing protein [Microvirga]|uniref:M10 family metallopeptidase C-terminal domain-containing protein n=1 Tax=Microvirga TaxID=186650 RepID=UPI0021C9BB06|nr:MULTISPECIES: M10 family metallopeptidase C-terminal domain-containing protein [unclassified Microvirga]